MDELQIFPYIDMGGTWSLPDSVICDLWARMEAEGTSRRVFIQGGVTSADGFVKFLKTPMNVPCFVIQGPTVLFLAWLNNIDINSAFAHFVGFRDGWGSESWKLMRKVLDYWFTFEKDGEPLFDVILGAVPETNRLALKFVEKAGVKIVGKIPKLVNDVHRGRKIGAVLCYVERGD